MTAAEQPPHLHAQFTPTADEFVLFARHSRALARRMAARLPLPAHKGVMFVLRFVLPLCAVTMFVSSLYLTVNRDFMWLSATVISGALLWAFAAAYLGWGAAKKARERFAKDPRLGYPAIVEADDRGFRYYSDRVRYELDWAAVAGVYQAGDVLFVFDTDRLIYIIPRRAFASPADADKLVKWIEQHTRASDGAARGPSAA